MFFEGRRKLVSVEVEYLKGRLGKTATDDQIRQELIELTRISWDELMRRYEAFE